jgi:peroxiredoxin
MNSRYLGKTIRMFATLTTLVALAWPMLGADTPPAAGGAAKSGATNAITTRLNKLIQDINTKLKANKRTEADLAEELKGFDTLMAENKNDKTDALAQVAWMKAMLYLQVLDQPTKAREMLAKIKQDFPNSRQAPQVEATLAQMEKTEAAKVVQRSLAVGSPFPDFQEKDLDGKPLSVSRFKGKVLLVDFWATWCGPCRVELPNVLSTYDKHRKNGFEILGISLDQDEKKLRDFMKENKMTWPQFFDGQGWGNKLAGKYGVNSIPATYLLDTQGKIIAKDLRGEALEQAVADALKKK